MARTHLSTAAVARILDRTSSPICILGFDRNLRYLNPACANWLQLDAEQAVGLKCLYTSAEVSDPLQHKISGLCPPPAVFEFDKDSPNHIGEFFICSRTDRDRPSWRSASAFRFFEPGVEEPLVLVIGSAEAIEALPQATPDSEAIHRALLDLRNWSRDFYHLDGLLGASPFAHRVRRQATMASQSQSDLLIVGEPGTGREYLARTVHATGAGASGTDLIPIHCPVADQQMMQAMIRDVLSRRKSRPSATSLNDRNCLLLLDVDQLNPAAQNELLGFLQLPEFPIRLIATSATPLCTLAGRGEFQSELASFLETMTIELDPLCKRLEDIPILAQAVLERVNLQRDHQLAGLDPTVMQLFQEYHWPHNLDELRDVVTQAAAQAASSTVTAADLPKKFQDSISAMRIGSGQEVEIDLDNYLRSIEKELLRRAIHQAKGNKTRGAKLLGISRAKFLRRLQQFGIHIDTPASQISESEAIAPSAFEEID